MTQFLFLFNSKSARFKVGLREIDYICLELYTVSDCLSASDLLITILLK